MKICPNCSCQNNDNALYCSSCGVALLPEQQNAAAPSQAETQNPPYAQQTQPNAPINTMPQQGQYAPYSGQPVVPAFSPVPLRARKTGLFVWSILLIIFSALNCAIPSLVMAIIALNNVNKATTVFDENMADGKNKTALILNIVATVLLVIAIIITVVVTVARVLGDGSAPFEFYFDNYLNY